MTKDLKLRIIRYKRLMDGFTKVFCSVEKGRHSLQYLILKIALKPFAYTEQFQYVKTRKGFFFMTFEWQTSSLSQISVFKWYKQVFHSSAIQLYLNDSNLCYHTNWIIIHIYSEKRVSLSTTYPISLIFYVPSLAITLNF